jgi:hypothetical protein
MSHNRLVTLSNNARPSVPELGRIRLGEPKVDPKKPGKPIPFFRVEFHPAYKHLQPLWDELHPTEPDALNNIFAAYPEAERAFTSGMEEWTGAKVLNRRCDGQTIWRWYDSTKQRYYDTPLPCQCAALEKPVCRMVGRLYFIYRDFFEFAAMKGYHALGYFVMATSSRHNISRIDALLHGVQQQYGTLQGVPFLLERTKEEMSTPIPANPQRGTPATRILKEHFLIGLRTADSFAPYAANALLEVGAQPVAMLPMGSQPEQSHEPIIVETVSETVATNEEVIDADHYDVPERRECDLKAVTVAKDSQGMRYLRFVTDLEFDAFRRSRDIFINRGWIEKGDWEATGRYELKQHITAIIEKDGKGYWQVIDVIPVGQQ